MFDDEDELLIDEEVEVVDTIESHEPIEVVLSGVLLDEELEALKSLCCEKSDVTFPFFVRVGNTKSQLGEIYLELSVLLNIYMISDKYSLLLINNVQDISIELFDKDNISKSLEKFISI